MISICQTLIIILKSNFNFINGLSHNMLLPSHCVVLPSLYSRVASTPTPGCIVQYSYMVIAITSQWNQNLIKALWSVARTFPVLSANLFKIFKSNFDFWIWIPTHKFHKSTKGPAVFSSSRVWCIYALLTTWLLKKMEFHFMPTVIVVFIVKSLSSSCFSVNLTFHVATTLSD